MTTSPGLRVGFEERFDIGAEAFAVKGAVEQAGGVDAVIAQGGKKRRGLPAAVRNLVDEALAFGRPAAQAGHVGFHPGPALGLDPRVSSMKAHRLGSMRP